MDKLKTRVLFVALIILALVSVSAVAAADVDDVVSADQEEIDLSEETVSDVEEASDVPQKSDVLSADSTDEDQLKAEGDSTVTVLVEIRNSTGDITYGNFTGIKHSKDESIALIFFSITFPPLVANLVFKFSFILVTAKVKSTILPNLNIIVSIIVLILPGKPASLAILLASTINILTCLA